MIYFNNEPSWPETPLEIGETLQPSRMGVSELPADSPRPPWRIQQVT